MIKALKITEKILKWLEIFFKKGQKGVKINGHLLDWVWVLSDVPQGPVLGPLLFLTPMIGINRNTQNANLGTFADNTRIWQWLNTIHLPPNIYKLHKTKYISRKEMTLCYSTEISLNC